MNRIFSECWRLSERRANQPDVYSKVLADISLHLEEAKDLDRIERYRASIDILTSSILVTVWVCGGVPIIDLIPVYEEVIPEDNFDRASSVL